VLSLILAVAEPSKTPFYIAGGFLALYAVALAAVGLTRPNFPGNGGGARGVMGLSFILVVVTIAMAIATDP
jgi:hypothetical protein